MTKAIHKDSDNRIKWDYCKSGIIDVIMPASKARPTFFTEIEATIKAHGFEPRFIGEINQEVPFTSDTDENRFKSLFQALNSDSIAIYMRGGYGTTRLLPMLHKKKFNLKPKALVGFSDITAMHLYAHKYFNLTTLHAQIARETDNTHQKIVAEEIFKALRGEITELEYPDLRALNELAKQNNHIISKVTGGNLTLIEASLGTFWQIDSNNKIIFIEDVTTQGYRVDRSLTHLQQAGVFDNAVAVIFGDFTDHEEENGEELINLAIDRFSSSIEIPVFRICDIGHGLKNRTLPLNTDCHLISDQYHASIKCDIGGKK